MGLILLRYSYEFNYNCASLIIRNNWSHQFQDHVPRDDEQLMASRAFSVDAVSYLINGIDKDLRVELLLWANMTSYSWASILIT